MKNDLMGVYFELTQKCNLRCIHCYNESGDLQEEIDLNAVKRTIDFLVLKNLNSITLSGGEPFLYFKIYELLIYCEQKKINVNIISNLNYINNDVIQLIQKNNWSIQVSVDGINDIYNEIRKKGNFKLLSKNIDIIYNKGISPSFNYVINKLNSFQIEQFVDLVATKWPNSSISFSFINYSGRAIENSEKLNMSYEEKEKSMGVVNSLHDKYKNLVKKLEYTTSCPFNNYNDCNLNIRIDANGNVYPCQISSGSKYIIGNIYECALDEIINSNIFLNLRKKIIEGSKCKQCIWNKNCGHCCPIEVNEQDNSLGCYMFKKNCKEILLNYKMALTNGIYLCFFQTFNFLIKFNEINIDIYKKIEKFFKNFIVTSVKDYLLIEINKNEIIMKNEKQICSKDNICITLLKLIEEKICENNPNGIMLHGGLISKSEKENIIVLGKTKSGKSTSIYNIVKNNQNVKYGGDDLIYFSFITETAYPFPKPIFLRENINLYHQKLDVEHIGNEIRYIYYPNNILKNDVKINKIYILERDKKYTKQIIEEINGGVKLIEFLKCLKEKIKSNKVLKINKIISKIPIFKLYFYNEIKIIGD